jgi:hypothetical protein
MKTIKTDYSTPYFGMIKPKNDVSKTMDWEAVTKFIEENEEALHTISAGLAEDYKHTSTPIWDCQMGLYPKELVEGLPRDPYFASYWATPCIEVVFKSGVKVAFEMWKEGHEPKSYFGISLSGGRI